MAAPMAVAEPGSWQVTQRTAALTGGSIYVAETRSQNPILNQIGRSDTASLVIRCEEGVLGVFVVWPQVVSHDLDAPSLFSDAQTVAFLRVDDRKVAEINLDISGDGVAAGRFATKGARKLLDTFSHSGRVVVRLRGSNGGPQDAVFATTGIDQVASAASDICDFESGASRQQNTPKVGSPASGTTLPSGPGGMLLGIKYFPLTPQFAAIIHSKASEGVVVARVEPGSVADRAGFAVGDVLVAIDGKPIVAVANVKEAISAETSGSHAVFTGYRGNEPLTLTARF